MTHTLEGAETRARILREASVLFATRGFYGTSTRDIADAVGIRQPSLYNHFSAKHEILRVLLDSDLISAVERLETLLSADGPWAPRLYAYLRWDAEAILRLPYDVRGLYNEQVLLDPEFTEQAVRREDLHRLTRRLVSAGVKSQEYVDGTDPVLVQAAISGLILEAVRAKPVGPDPGAEAKAVKIADFIVRAILRQPARLSVVRRTGLKLLSGSSALHPS